MKQLKFRAWNFRDSRPDKRMIYEVYLSRFGGVMLDDGEYYSMPVMQFTGISDNLGVDIYEGDIVKDSSGAGFEVVFFEQSASFRPLGEFLSEFHVTYSDGFTWVDNRFEVIGNIHENPELR